MRLLPIAKKVVANRLLHFAAIALVLFFLLPREKNANDVELSADQVATLFTDEARRAERPLSAIERKRALDAFIAEEILYREGKRLGLDKDDAIVRARVVKKMRALAEEAAGTGPTPASEAALRAYFAENSARFREPAAARFDYVFVLKEKHGDAGARLASEIADLLAKDPDQPLAGKGDRAGPFALEGGGGFATDEQVAPALGRAVADAVFRGPLRAWSAPIVASYGWYIVRVTERREEGVVDFDRARPRIAAELAKERAARGADALLERVAGSYRVRVEVPAGDPLLGAGAYRFAPPKGSAR